MYLRTIIRLRSQMVIAVRVLAILMLAVTRVQPASPGAWEEEDYCYKIVQFPVRRNFVIIKMADHYTDNPELNDPWFDRLVYVYSLGDYDRVMRKPIFEIDEPPIAIAAVVIDKNRVLSAFNPLRNVMSYKFKRHYTFICYNYERHWKPTSVRVLYLTRSQQVACARPVVPVSEDQRPDMWQQFGFEPKAHLPLHDLVVMRGDAPFRTLDNGPYYTTSKHDTGANFLRASVGTTGSERLGPVLTLLARQGDDLGINLKFGMFGHILSGNLTERRNIVVHEYKTEDAVTDCDAWIPRSWGIFICLKNIRDLKQLPSGSMLYSKGLLFGIGCFALFREARSVLVFTDVRPYYELIQNTCTEEDQNLEPPSESSNITIG